MTQRLVYDLPTRIFHGVFLTCFLVSFAVAKGIDDESPKYVIHMISGMVLSAAVILRIIWGLMGTRYARFTGFALQPGQLVQYFRGVIRGKYPFFAGHNPASSWAALLMMTCGLGLGATGALMSLGADKEVWEEVHELLAHVFFLTAVAHVLGVGLYFLQNKVCIGVSMVFGTKMGVSEQEAISSSKRGWGVAFLAAILVWGYFLVSHYEPETGALNLGPWQLQLHSVNEGMNEHHE